MDQKEKELQEKAKQYEKKQDDVHKFLTSASKSYVKKEDKSKEEMSSGLMFIVFGIGGEIFLILCQLHVLAFRYTLGKAAFVGVMFGAFVLYGIYLIVKSKKMGAEVSGEKQQEDSVKAFLAEHMTKEWVEEHKDSQASAEENDLTIMSEMQKNIHASFPTLSEDFVECIVEEYYEEKFM